MSGIAPFTSDQELCHFAHQFLCDRIDLLKKDVGLCLTANAQGSHAYFPALITCISFLDLLSGLNAGTLEKQRIGELLDYTAAFLDSVKYPATTLAVFYISLRHKIAHLSHPFVVYDTDSSWFLREKMKIPRKRVTWTIDEAYRDAGIELVPCPPRALEKTPTPWLVTYDHRIIASIPRLRDDAIDSVDGLTGYRRRLLRDATARQKFARCMVEYYPPVPS